MKRSQPFLTFGTLLRTVLHEQEPDILVTKVLLGTMGCIPAFDTYFKKGFGDSTFGPKALCKIAAFASGSFRRNRRRMT
jgi:hypothetical protein